MKMTENETTQPSISQLFRQLKEGGKALDVEKRILESLLRRVAEDQRWYCKHCGGEIPESRRRQAIEDFVHWGSPSSIKPRARDTSWDDWVEGIFIQHTEDQFAGVRGIGPYFCSTACVQEEREYQEWRINAREEAERQPVEETMGEYGWCSDHEMPINEGLASYKGYRCLDCEHVESAEDIEWFSIEEYAAEHKISTWKVRQMIKSGEVDAKLMDKTRAWNPITRSIAPLKKWFIIVRKPTAVSE